MFESWVGIEEDGDSYTISPKILALLVIQTCGEKMHEFTMKSPSFATRLAIGIGAIFEDLAMYEKS